MAIRRFFRAALRTLYRIMDDPAAMVTTALVVGAGAGIAIIMSFGIQNRTLQLVIMCGGIAVTFIVIAWMPVSGPGPEPETDAATAVDRRLDAELNAFIVRAEPGLEDYMGRWLRVRRAIWRMPRRVLRAFLRELDRYGELLVPMPKPDKPGKRKPE